MAALSPEESYVRMNLLLTDVSQRAVQSLFDREFPPVTLKATLYKNVNKLYDLKTRRVINQAQWTVLFPSSGNVESKTFDVSLMICLIRYLTNLAHTYSGFENLPHPGEIAPFADLARIKYYRNYFAHLDDNKIDNSVFSIVWDEISEAIGRLGGTTMLQECKDLKTKNLGKSNEDIIATVGMETESSNRDPEDSFKDTVPRNISARDNTNSRIEDAATFKTLLSEGEYESYGNRIYLGGACNVGKSTLASLLIGDEIPLKWKSTDGLRIFFGRNGIDVEKRKMVPLKRGQGVLSHVLHGNPDVKQEQSEKGMFSLKPAQLSPTKSKRQIHEKPDQNLPTIEFIRIHEDIKEEIRRGEYKVHIAPSDLVDFGGQKSYDMTHQLFIQGKGTFTLIFDGRKSLHDILEEYPQGDVTTESILKHWVDSILTYCGVDDGDVVPVILFVATHRDSFNNEDEYLTKIQEFKEGLSTMFQNHERRERIKYDDIFFINATDENDPEVERLKAKYVEIAMNQKSWGKPMPMAWVPLDLQMSEMREKHISLISKEELEKVNENNDDLAVKDNELNRFLKEQHSLGKIMYYEGHGLEKYIIVQPTAVVDILRSFITDQRFFPSDMNLAQILKDMTNTGKITKEDLFKLWSQYEFNQHMPTKDSKDFVCKVLVHLDLLVEPKRDVSQVSSNFFLVPCVVKHKPPDFLKDLENDKTLVMSYKLPKSSIPSALTFKLIGAVLNVWPLKETENGICLYHKAAFLDVNKDNEMRILGRDNQVVVCLLNKTTKGFISPDIASTAQECLTLAMKTALEFYHNSFGKIVSNEDICNLLQINVGEKCGTNLCYISLADAKTKSTWKCAAGKEHKTKMLLYWSYDKAQEYCATECTGPEEILSSCPSEQHLVRLAAAEEISIYKFREFVTFLGVKNSELEDIEFTNPGHALMIKFGALCAWKKSVRRKLKQPSFKMLHEALKGAQLNIHLLCKIFREETQLLEVKNETLQQKPEDATLLELSKSIGNCALHLGVELGLETAAIEETIFRHIKDMFAQNYDVLIKWSKSGSNTTVCSLMRALQIVDFRGLEFLDNKYNIGLFE